MPNPTYLKLGDHTETVEIDFDPTRVTYAQLLEIFWDLHNPCAKSGSRQYMSAIFCRDDSQKKTALESKELEEAKRGKIATEILPATKFTMAEDYHQKYYLRNMRELMKEFDAIYPDAGKFAASTAAARVNGYVGGNGSRAALKAELESLGLSEEAVRRLWACVRE